MILDPHQEAPDNLHSKLSLEASTHPSPLYRLILREFWVIYLNFVSVLMLLQV